MLFVWLSLFASLFIGVISVNSIDAKRIELISWAGVRGVVESVKRPNSGEIAFKLAGNSIDSQYQNANCWS
jgi:hypothetical protein